MSGFEVLSLLSAIVSLVDGASKLCTAIQNTHHLPQAFREVARRLPLAQNTLQMTESQLQKHDASGDTYMAIKPMVLGCKEKAERLNDILRDVAAQPDASRIERYHLAVRRLGKEGKVEELMKGLLEDIQALAANQAVRAANEDAINDLRNAIETLSKTTPSALEDSTFEYYGTGDMWNNVGSGVQTINKGEPRQYFARSMTFS